MAAITGAVLAVGGAAYQANRANKAAGAQERAAGEANALQRQQYDQTRADLSPYMDAGANALARMQRLNSGDFSQFYESPDYAFARDQGLQGIDRSAAARGSLFSGGADADRMTFASGLASQNYGNFYSRLADMANMGQNSATQTGQFGQNMAGQVGNNMIGAGNARAGAYQAQGNAWANAAGSLAGFAGMYGGGGKSTYGGKGKG